ncbi:retrovirus-related pol polyprotein from transposon TNT 1-94 [Tanacetum coccineum]
MPLSTYLNLGLGELAYTKLTIELADRIVKHPRGIAENVLVGIGKFIFPVALIILEMPEDINAPLILRRPFLSTAHTKVNVFKRKITLRVGDEKIVFKSIKPTSSLIKKVYMLGLRERMDLDLEARLMGETLILNRSFDPLYGDYIELNNLNEPLNLKRNRVDDLEPIIEEGEVVNGPMMDIVKTRCNFISGLDDYPSNYDFDKRIHIDFVEDMDPYLDEGMGDVIVGEPFCKASCMGARRFDEIITIRNGDDSVTYQMVRSNPRFKHLTNEKCNKIPSLLKGLQNLNLQAQLQAELEEEEKLARQKEEEANIALIESWDNTQAMIDADRLLAERLQAREQEDLTDEEKARLYVELLEKRKKHFAALRAQEKRNKPPTKAQKKSTMSTYLKHMAGYKQSQLKNK